MAHPVQRDTHPARLLVVTLVALGLLARLTLALMMPPAKAVRLPHARPYLRLAQSLAGGHGFVLKGPAADNGAGRTYLAARMPGYPLLVAGAARVLGAPARGALVVQALCGAGAMLLAAWAAYRLAGRWAAVTATALLAFDPFQVLFAGLATPVPVTAFPLTGVAVAGVLTIEAVREGRRAWPCALAGGLAMAAAVYVQVWTLALAPVALMAAVVSRRRGRLLAGWAIAAAVMLAALAPWLVRNAMRVGAPVLVTTVGWQLVETPRPAGDANPAGTEPAGPEATPPTPDIGRLVSDPAGWLAGGAERVTRLWSPGMPEGLENGPLNVAAGYTSLLPAALLAVLGLWRLCRRGEVWWLLLVPVALTGIHGVLGGWAGERAAVLPTLAVLGGAGLAALLGRRSESARETTPPEDGRKPSPAAPRVGASSDRA